MLEHALDHVPDLASRHALLTYLVVGLSALLEAIPVVGTVFPGSMLIVGLSALASSGTLNPLSLVISAFVGAIAGDGLSFWIGCHYQSRIARIWPISRYPDWLNRAKSLFSRHGGKSVFTARFVQGPRAFVPLVAGMSQMPAGRFYLANIASALIWAPSHVLVGVIVGTSLQVLEQIGGRLALLAGLVAALAWAILWISRRILLPYGKYALSSAQKGVMHRTTMPTTWAGQCLARVVRSISGMRTLTIGALMVVLECLWLFSDLLEDLVTDDSLVQANQAVFHALQTLRSQWGDSAMLVITEMGDGFVTTSLTLAITAWFLIKRSWYSAAYWVIAVGGAALFTPGIKAWVQWPRPTANLYSGWELFSFPSGHATINTVLYGFLAYLIARSSPARWHRWIIGTAYLIIFMIAFSRLYLGAHWFADVVAGMSLGTAWVILLALLHHRSEIKKPGVKGLILVFLITLAITWPYHVSQQLDHDRSRYTPELSVQKSTWSDWLNGKTLDIPAKRIDLAGETEEQLVLQWAGDLSLLSNALERGGWQVDTPWSLHNTLAWLDPNTSEALFPILPRLNDGRPAALSASANVAGEPTRRVVLQVWPTLFRLVGACGPAKVPLWTGSLRLQEHTSILGLIALEKDREDASYSQPALFKAIKDDPDLEVRQLIRNNSFDILAGYPRGLQPCGDA
ncbi:phosphatase PAP2 family protein [Salinicola corii]|uniref:Phosphatase PAP2 family protein n=1 Tax=Salinicola corii TaxID=2606937 RepID=A0A640W7W5_9GAMM|nr:bifunctional DedA family/phosphatase PAP2 family protein [Salinicola corii]KAA0015769.1 phosphatase PAP2 family protein [Salinicola corii]MAM58926.1 hypothetical protein [Salinicola sp.]